MENLYLIVGLGNPGSEYAQTRHNVGFLVVEQLARRCRAAWKTEDKFQSRIARTDCEGRRVVLMQPQTFMNSSGTAVQAVASFYKAPVDQVLVVVDDADLPFGEIRLRGNGSSGGHHGLESVEQHLGTRNYARQRVGIGRRVDGVREITGYVLGRFGHTDMPVLKSILERACQQIDCWLVSGIVKAMNDFNGMINTSLVKES